MRMTLRDRHEVAHFWANKVQSEGKASNVFFRDETIYSYGAHFPIAKHIAPNVVAFTTRDYSLSTSQHKSIVRNAIPAGVEIIYIPNVRESVESNKDSIEKTIEGLIEQAAKARRQSTRSAPLAEALQLATRFNRFAQVMKSRARINTKKLNIGSIDELKKFVATKEIRMAAAAKKKHAALMTAQAVARKLWRAGQGRYVSGDTMLRLNTDRTEVETSLGADIPIAAALKLWPIILRVKGGTKDYEVGMELGHYRLTQIKQNGDIVVGCHNIAFAEIEGIAHELDLTDTSEAHRAFQALTQSKGGHHAAAN